MKFPSLACVPKVHGAKFRFPTLLLYRNKSERMDIGTGSISLYLSFPLISCTTLNWYSNPSVTKKKNSLSLDYSFHYATRVCVCVETINTSCPSELDPFRASIFLTYYYLSGFVFVLLPVSSPKTGAERAILVCNDCSARSRRECWCVVYGYLCSCIPSLLFTNYSSIFVLRSFFLSRLKYFCFRFLTLFFSHLFLFASSPKKNGKNCLTNTLVVLLMLFSFSLSLSLPFLPSSSNYLSRFLFYYTQVFIFVFTIYCTQKW